MVLLQLLRLLLVTLLHLLGSRIINPLLRQALVILLLFLLQPLPILLLLGIHLVLLLLVFLIDLLIARVRRRWPLMRRKFVHVSRWTIGIVHADVVCPNSVAIATRLRWRYVVSARLSGRHDAALVECRRPGSSRDRRLALIHGSAQLPIGARLLDVLHLWTDRRQVPLTRGCFLLPRCTLVNAAVSAVVTHAIDRRVFVYDRRVVGVVNLGDIDVVHRAVVVEVIMVPAAAFITVAEISIAIVDPTVKSDARAPVAFVKDEGASAPAPITWRPQIADSRRLHPRAGHPVIIAIFVIPRPVSRRPDIALGWTYRLFVHRQRRWCKSY